MNVKMINYDTLSSLATRYPSNFGGLQITIEGIKYQDKIVKLGTFNVNDLLSGDSLFASEIDRLSSYDIYNIIKLHVDFLGIDDNKKSNYSFEELYKMIESNDTSISQLDNYFSEINLLVDYEDYLLPPLKRMLEEYKNSVLSWSFSEDISKNQQKAVNNYKDNLSKQNNNDIYKLKKVNNQDNFGFASLVQIVSLTIAAILTLVVIIVIVV